MLKRLVSYSALALTIQLVTGLITKIVEMFVVADILSEAELGTYRHYLLVLELSSGFFVIGIDHAMVTFINRRPENPGIFLRLFFTHGIATTALFLLAGALSFPFVTSATVLAFLTGGPFVFLELGKIVFRAKFERTLEFRILLWQSLSWSMGCLILLPLFRDQIVPLVCTMLGVLPIAFFMVIFFVRRARRETGSASPASPFAPEYDGLWSDFRPLWVAGLAFLFNNHVVNLLVDGTLSRADFGRFGFVLTALTFLHKPLLIVQRATLPAFSAEKEKVPEAFRMLVRINLVFFPSLCLGVLTAWPLILRWGSLAEKYGDTWIFFAIPVAVIPVMAVEFLLASASMALGHPQMNRNAHVATAFLNVPLAAFLVLRFGVLGASAACAGQVLIFASCIFFFVGKRLPDLAGYALKRLLLGLLGLWGIVFAMHASGRPLAYGFPALLVWLVWAYVVGFWRLEDLARLRASIKGR